MFFTSYSPAYPDMMDYNMHNWNRPYRARKQATDDFSPQDFLAILNPWAPQQSRRSCGGKMSRMRTKRQGNYAKVAPKVITVTEEPWQASVKADGFEQKDFTIFLRGRTIVIHGRKSEGNVESGFISKQFRKNVTLPKDFITPSLDVSFEDGIVLLSGKRCVFKKSERHEEDAEKLMSRLSVGSQKENEEKNTKDVEESIAKEDCPCDSKYEGSCESTCDSCDCSAESESDTVVMEDIGPEEEADGVRMEFNCNDAEEAREDNSLAKTDDNDTLEVADKLESPKDSKEEECCRDLAKKSEESSETSSEVSEYKPIQWSIPFEGFEPNDVKVRLEDNIVRVFAEHKEEKEGTTLFRRTERSFSLPQNADSNTLTSRFNSDEGKLTIQVMPDKKSERPQNHESPWITVPIMFM